MAKWSRSGGRTVRDFLAMVDRLVDDNRALLPCRPTVEKEFLQTGIWLIGRLAAPPS